MCKNYIVRRRFIVRYIKIAWPFTEVSLRVHLKLRKYLSDSGDLSYTVVSLWETMIEMETVAMSRMKVPAEGKLHPNYPFPVAALSIKH